MALVDPNIALSYRGIQLQDPLEQYNKASAAQLNALKMDELMQERDALNQIRATITAKGGPPDLEAAAQAMVSTGRPQFVQSGMAILEKLQNQKNYEQYRRDIEGAPAASAPAPANALAPAAATAETPPANALAAPRAAAAPTVSPQTQELMNRIRRVSQLGEVGKPEAAILKMQLENQLRAEASDRMLTPEQEAQKIRIAQSSRPSSLLTPEEEAQKVRLAQANRTDKLLTPEEEAQRIRVALASRPPVQPQPPQPPVSVVDPNTGKPVLVSREEAISRRMTPAVAQEGLPPKEIQARESKYPQATAAIKSLESSTDRLVTDLEKLAKHPGLSGISGLVYGRTPAITKDARAAQALYDSIIARGGFQELQNMRAASPTGGALGSISNQEGQYLRDAFAPINRTQDTADLKNALQNAANAARGSKQRMREAYDLTYQYRTQQEAAPSGAQSTGGWSVVR